MTNDTAPERIWAWRFTGEQNRGSWLTAEVSHADAQYVRADLTTRQRDEAVAGMRLAATTELLKNHLGGQMTHAASAVQALTPADATAALEAHDAETWNAAMQYAWEIFEELVESGRDPADEAEAVHAALKRGKPNAD